MDYVTQTLESQGSPIKFVYPAEDTIAISSPIALVKGCANPDNGKLLYDFILSEEGQTVLMKADCTPIRDGVAKEGALSASEIATIALKPDEAKLAQEKQDTLDTSISCSSKRLFGAVHHFGDSLNLSRGKEIWPVYALKTYPSATAPSRWSRISPFP